MDMDIQNPPSPFFWLKVAYRCLQCEPLQPSYCR